MLIRHIRHIYRSIIWLALAVVLALGGLFPGVIRQARASSPRLLPNLVADPPDNVSFETSRNEGGLSKTEGEARLLLRFNGYVHNAGEGALDIRGSRESPNVSPATEKEVEEVREHNQVEEKKAAEEHREPELLELSQGIEKELTSPQMQVSQQLFTTNSKAPTTNPEKQAGESEVQYKERFAKFAEENEQYLQREHEHEASGAEMFYVSADGHHHWHLQRVAKYSLWNATKTAEVAPAEKVGFCLEDSEHVEAKGPTYPVYADSSPPYRDFCQQYRPNATFVFEGISPGWRDRYTSNLGFQWVDISDVLPGEYWLREDVNPTGAIKEEGGGKKSEYATKPTIVPGFDALPQSTGTQAGVPLTITVSAKAWEDKETPNYAIVSPPQHGTLEPVSGTERAIYRPEAGYTGPDSFTFSASDPTSEFPRNPAVATVSINVGAAPTPSVAISGAPAEMIAGTSVQLSALVTNDSPGVTWSASAGSITPGGLYTAPSEPPAGGTIAVAARSTKGAQDQATITILPVPPPQAAPAATVPSTLPSSRPPGVYRPEAILIGRRLIMTTRVGEAGRLRLSAYLGRRLLGTCVTKTPANRSFTCRLTLGKRFRLNAPISVLASLRIGSTVLRSLRPAARVPEMKMTGPSRHLTKRVLGDKPSSWQFLCSPSMM
jgi:Lysyl oxidase/Bacterial Ig domain